MRRRIGALGAIVVAVLLVACGSDGAADGTPIADATAAPATATATLAPPVIIEAGDNIQAVVDRHPAGTYYVLRAGLYREQSVLPQRGDIFEGEPGAIISGARILEGFVEQDGRWSIDGQTQQSQPHGGCGVPEEFADIGVYSGCSFAEQLFFDDEPLWQVTSEDLLAPGRWYFDYDADRIVVVDDPTGHVVEASTTSEAFGGDASNVTIRGLVVEKYSNPAQRGAVHAGGAGWIVEDCEIRLNHGFGLRIGPEMQVLNNNVHHNGQVGLGGIGDNSLIEGNEIAFNNTAGFLETWEAGGTKFVLSDGLVVRDNWVHHNNGRGLWTDIDVVDVLITDNLVEWNTHGGIVHEVSYRARIVNNVSSNNGLGFDTWVWGAQILVQNSADVEVSQNLVTISALGGNGITIVNQERGSGDLGPYVSARVSVTDNTIRHMGDRGSNGAPNGCNSEANAFDGNRYEAPAAWFTDTNFEWCGLKSWGDFQATGQEAAGVSIELS